MSAASRTLPMFAEPDLAPQRNLNEQRVGDVPKLRRMPLMAVDRFGGAAAEHLCPLLDRKVTLCGRPTSGLIDEKARGLPRCQACNAEASRMGAFVMDGLRP